MYQDIVRAKFILEAKCIGCDESEQGPLKTVEAAGLPR